jgi:DNA-binding transcriptional ArsR family regulator
MNRHYERLLSELRRRGVLTPGELQTALGVSQSTISRAISENGGDRIVRIGRARATRYGLRRDVRGLGSEWPLYRICYDGRAELVGQLHALAGGNWYLQQSPAWETLRGSEFDDGVYPDLPWFLQDLRPRGFLGRMLARHVATELGTPRDPRDWGGDDIVHFLLVMGSDLSGSFVLGQRALEAAQSDILNGRGIIDVADRERAYPVHADAVTGGEVPGSSAAGEQPKFTARVSADSAEICGVIVKFSGRGGRPEDQRWADLLVAENVANNILTEAGVPCAATTVLQADGRCFLESLRFDRTSAGGRVGIVTLEAFDNAFFGAIETRWTDAARRYRRANWLSEQDAARLAMVWWFGNLIGNTDMHYGNVSLLLGPDRPLSLAPVYDMVPMLYRPGIEGHLPSAPVSPIPPPPEALLAWTEAARLAERFWSELAGNGLASPAFRSISAGCLDVVARMRAKWGR